MNAETILNAIFTLGGVACVFWLGYGAWLCLGEVSFRRLREAQPRWSGALRPPHQA